METVIPRVILGYKCEGIRVKLADRYPNIDKVIEKIVCTRHPGYLCDRDWYEEFSKGLIPKVCRTCFASWLLRQGIKAGKEMEIFQ